MSNKKIRFDYDELWQMAKIFGAQWAALGQVNRKIKEAQSTLEGGDWIGKGAKAFFQEMNNDVNPSMKRLAKAMEEASNITQQIKLVAESGEAESAKLLGTITITERPAGPTSVVDIQ